MTINGQFDVLAIFDCPAPLTTTGGECCYCHAEFPIEDFYIGDIASQGRASVCHICAWERAPNLMRLMQFYKDTVRFAAHPPVVPETVRAELTRRANDPKRLKCELQEALEWVDNHGLGAPVTSPLLKLVAGQIKAALNSGNVKKMIEAKEMVKEVRNPALILDDEIPF